VVNNRVINNGKSKHAIRYWHYRVASLSREREREREGGRERERIFNI
jgi:hypothetical protein